MTKLENKNDSWSHPNLLTGRCMSVDCKHEPSNSHGKQKKNVYSDKMCEPIRNIGQIRCQAIQLLIVGLFISLILGALNFQLGSYIMLACVSGASGMLMATY
jgi:hypothetical protein